MQFNKKIEIILKKKYIIVLLKNKMFLKQTFVKGEKKIILFFLFY